MERCCCLRCWRSSREPPLLSAEEAPEEDEVSPEDASWPLSRLLFFWAFPVLWRGYRRGRTDLEDLPPVPAADRPSVLVAEILSSFPLGLDESRRSWASPLVRRLFQVTWPVFLQACICQALLQVFSYLQPILLHGLLQSLSMPEEQRKEQQLPVALHSLGIAGAVMGMWIFAEYAWTIFVRADLRAQALLSHLTYRKSLHLRLDGSAYTIGDLQNHFSTDCSKPVQSFVHYSHAALVVATVTVIVVAWHLTSLIGSAGLVAMVVVASFAPLQLVLSSRTKRYSQKIQECRDVRGRLCNQFLSAMRVVKCFRLEAMALEMLREAREDELAAQWEKRKIYPFNNFLGSTVSLFGTIAAFVWLELVLDRPVDAAIAFTVLSWNNLLKNSMMSVPNQIATLLDAYVSVRRVQMLLACQASDRTWMQQELIAAAPQEPGLELSKRRGDDFHLQDCSIGWRDGERFGGVRGLSLKVSPGELLLISGPVGSGKTLLLEGLAGTRTPESGVCERAGRSTAYVAQRPWLLNGTLLDNVLFGRQEVSEMLQRTLQSCALLQDLDALPSGIHTLVGEEGVQLSGGQKQRVSLARAVYSGAEVVLLDDVLSALDAHVGHHVWEKAICGSLSGRTRILVTHQIQYWSHPAVSRILLLAADGSTEFLGTYDELLAEPSLQGRLAPARATAAAAEEAPSQTSSKSTVASSSAPSRERSAQEQRRTGHILRADLVAYAKACGGLGGVSLIAVLMVVYYGAQLASSLQLAAWSNANVQAEDSGHPEAREQSRQYLVQYLILCLLTGASCFSFFFGIQIVALRASREMHTLFMRGLIRTELRFFDLTPTGRALNRCLKDMATLDDNMPAAFRTLFECFMNCCISLLVLGLFAWEALVIVPPFMILYWLIMTVYRWPARDLRRLEGVSRSPGMSHFSDSVKGANTIRAYGHEGRFLQQNLHLLGQTQRTVYWFWVAQAWVSTSQEVLGTIALAVIAGVVGYRAYVGSLSPGLAGLALSYAMSMPRDLMWLSRRWASMEVEFVSIERIMEYARLRTEEEAAPLLVAGATESESAAVCAEDLYLQYDTDGPFVFNGLSLRIARGARAALVGRTGCGKSSFLSAIVRLYPLCGGHLQVHSHDVHGVSLSALRSTVRVLLQDPIFFTGTIRSNLLSQPPRGDLEQARDAGQEEALWQCLRKARLEGRVAALAKGLDAEVEENGLNFSQGERQLLCLARVLMEQPRGQDGALGPPLLLCDEPTAACDLATDRHIHDTLLHGLDKDWTLVVVCHRLHYVREFDNIFVFEEGRVVEKGSPDELLGQRRLEEGTGAPGLLTKMCQQQGVL